MLHLISFSMLQEFESDNLGFWIFCLLNFIYISSITHAVMTPFCISHQTTGTRLLNCDRHQCLDFLGPLFLAETISSYKLIRQRGVSVSQ